MRDVAIPAAVQSLKDERPYFDVSQIAEAPVKYVAWLDLMGSESIMQRSMGVSATFLGKLHTAALRTRDEVLGTQDDVILYPIVDGVYLTSPKQASLLRAIKDIMRRCALAFIFENKPLYHFMVRCCVAVGPIVEGTALWTTSHHQLRNNPDHSKHILFGPPVAAAYFNERHASPFGVWIDTSARVQSPDGSHPLSCTHWQWWLLDQNSVDTEIAQTLYRHLEQYLLWCQRCDSWLLYPTEDIERHLHLAQQYFTNVFE